MKNLLLIGKIAEDTFYYEFKLKDNDKNFDKLVELNNKILIDDDDNHIFLQSLTPHKSRRISKHDLAGYDRVVNIELKLAE